VERAHNGKQQEVMMRTNLKVILASIAAPALLASPAVAGAVGYSYYAPPPYYYRYYPPYAYHYYYAPYGYEYFGAPYYYRRGGPIGNPNSNLGNCVRRAFPQCSGGN
jgi:hypothetical protein